MLRMLAYAILFVMASSSFPAISQTSGNAPSSGQDVLLKPEELDALVAPIALYPDTLLATVLMASTYPLEVVQADRWAQKNKKVKGDALKAAVDKQGWDESVKSLVATPDVLSTMATQLEWTQKLGDAVLAQQPDVMDAVQRLRSRAEANNKLTTTSQQRVIKTPGPSGNQVIAIEQANPDTLYVPYYDPNVVYGGWSYADYPPYYFDYPSYYGPGWLATGLAFGAGWALGRWGWGGNHWGGGINWSNNVNNIIGNRPRVNPLAGNAWQHRPEHRQGLRYNNSNVAQKFGGNNIRQGAQNRDFRGRDGKQVLNPGSNRPGAGNRGGAGNRVSSRPSTKPAGNRSAARPATRPSGGRQTAGRGNVQHQRAARTGQHNRAARGASPGARASFASQGGRQMARGMGGGGPRFGGGGGGMRAGGGGGMRGGGGRGGGGRRSDVNLKHDIQLISYLGNGIGFYRFSYNGSERSYVGVLAQEVQQVMPEAVTRGPDGYLRVQYDKVGVPFETYDRWIHTGAQIPRTGVRLQQTLP